MSDGATLWLTGLSGSGKSTLAQLIKHALLQRECLAYILDGDTVRNGLNKDLGFSPSDRSENIRRISEVAKILTDAGIMTIVGAISPYETDRAFARQLHDTAQLPFIEIFVDAPLKICEKRDPKGLYKKARTGQIPDFTGISAPYEVPSQPEITIRTAQCSPNEGATQVMAYLEEAEIIKAKSCHK